VPRPETWLTFVALVAQHSARVWRSIGAHSDLSLIVPPIDAGLEGYGFFTGGEGGRF
jgi:hypothetical protein